MDITQVSHHRNITSPHLRGIGSADIVWASAASHSLQLQLSRFSETFSAASHLRIFASSRYWVCSYCGGFHSFTSSHLHISTSSHLRNFDHPDFLKPSPQLRIFASSRHWVCRYCVGFSSNASLHLRIFTTSQLRLSRFSEILSTASHLRGIGSGDMVWASAVSHLHDFGYPDFLKPSPQLRVFASLWYWVCRY